MVSEKGREERRRKLTFHGSSTKLKKKGTNNCHEGLDP